MSEDLNTIPRDILNDINYMVSEVKNPREKSFMRTALKSYLVGTFDHQEKLVDEALDIFFKKV